MASILKVDKLDPQSGTALEIGTSGDTISLPSGATLDISASTLTPPATMPASSAANLTSIPGANITGTIAAVSGANLTSLTATNLGSGTVPTARLGSGTASSSTVLYGDQTYKAEPGGYSVDEIDMWQLGDWLTGTAEPVTADWLQVDRFGASKLGTGMTESSGIFTFPSTGFWLYTMTWTMLTENAPNRGAYYAQTTLNNADYNKTLDLRPGAGMYGGAVANASSYGSCSGQAFFDVTSTSNCKIRFGIIQTDTANKTVGISTGTVFVSTVMFIKLADT